MPEECRYWRCRHCKKPSDNHTEARDCEESHLIPEKVAGYNFGEGDIYPSKIRVEFGNHRYQDYVLETTT